MNKFIGIGRNTKDGELRSTESGISVYRNTIAITNNYKNKDGNYDSEFINYVAYKNTAEYLNKYSGKGALIEIEGRLHNGSYEKDGEKKYFTEIVVETASSYKTQTEKETEKQEVPQNIKSNYDEDSDVQLNDLELPF